MNRLYSCLLIVLASCGIAHAQLPAYVPTNGLQAWYPFSGNANNAAATGKNGVVNGAVLTTDRFGTVGAAYHLNGDTDNITIDTTFFNIGWSNYTISCWINSDTLENPYNGNHNQAIINTIPHRGMEIYYNWGLGGKYGMLAGSDPTGFSWDILMLRPSSQDVVAHAWKHIVMVKRANYDYNLYIDGVLDTLHTTIISAPAYYSKMVIGNIDPATSSEGFYGKVDDYGIWNTALTGCDIIRLHNSSAFVHIVSQPVNVAASAGDTATFTVSDTSSGVTHQWQVNSGSGYTNLANTSPYSGVTTSTLTITGVTIALNTYKYRCVVAGSCTDTSGYGKLTVLPSGIANVNVANISLGPNPVVNEVVLTGAEKADIRIFNTVGQLVKTGIQVSTLSLADLAPGVYTARVVVNGAVYSQKLLKQ